MGCRFQCQRGRPETAKPARPSLMPAAESAAAGSLFSLKRPQGETKARHNRVPAALLSRRIPQIEAMNRSAGSASEIASTVINFPLVHGGNRKKCRSDPFVIDGLARDFEILPHITGRTFTLVALRINGQNGAAVLAHELFSGPPRRRPLINRENSVREIEAAAELRLNEPVPARLRSG